MRKITLMLGFLLLLFGWQASAQFTESFDAEIPSDWTVFDQDGQGETWQHSTSNPYSAPGVARISYESLAHEDYLITPQISVTEGVSDRISFYAASSSTTFIESFDVKLSTTGTAPEDFTVTLGSEMANGTVPNNYERFIYDLSAYDSEDVYIAIVATGTNELYLYVDDVVSDAIPSCFAPTDLMVDATTTETADISWTANNGETEWEVVYGTPDFDPAAEGTTETVTGSPAITLTGLTANTEYEVYVRADCGTEYSQFEGPVTFSTSCISTTIPFTQDFESVSTPDLPNCGTLENNGDGNNWKTAAGPSSYGFDSQVLTYGYDYSNPADTWYFTQGIELEAGINYKISYVYGTDYGTYTEKLRVSFGDTPTASAMATELDNHSYDGDAVSNTVYFDVDTDGVYYFGFQAHSDANMNYLYVDDIQVDLAPTCPEVSAISFDNITANTADISWTANGSETEWEVIYGVTDFDPDAEGETVSVTTNPETTLDNLDADTDYDVYVRAICTGETSDLVGPETFTTLVVCPTPTDLSISAIGTDSAQVSWTSNGSETEWEVFYGAPDFDPETEGTSEIVNTTPELVLTNLTPNTDYEVYVKALCDLENSEFVGPVAFATQCEASTVPFFDGFENGNTDAEALAGCWTQEGDQWMTNTSETSYNRTPRTGDWNVTLRYGKTAWMFYALELEAGTTYDLQFYARQDGTSGASIEASYGTQNTAAAMTNEIVASTVLGDGDYQEFTGSFTPDTDGVYYIGIKGDLNFTPWYISLDDVSVNETAACPAPTDIVVSAITGTTADISWTSNGSETEWEVVYGAPDFDPETEGVTETVNTTPELLLTNLSPNTDYEVYVKALCNTEDSEFGGPVAFATQCEASTVPFFDGFENGNTDAEALAGCWTQEGDQWMTNTSETTYNRTPRTGDWNATLKYNKTAWMFYALELEAGITYDLQFYARQDATSGASIEASYGTENTAAAMTNEIVASTVLGNGDYQEFTGSFTPDTDGVYYIGIKGDLNFTPWYISLDDVSVNEAATCPAPTDIVVSAITENTADISWTSNGSETEWEIVYGLPGFNPATEGTTVVDTDALGETLTGLDDDTTYEVYIRAICATDDESDFAGPEEFTTEMLSVASQDFKNFNYYPNPVSSTLTLKASTQIESVEVFNLLGQNVLQLAPNKLQTNIDTQALSTGVYLMKVSINGTQKTFRIIKE